VVTFVGTLARGLRSRALLSAGSVLLTAVALGSAMLGPMFQQAVGTSYAISRIGEEPNTATGFSLEFAPDAGHEREPGPTLATVRREVEDGNGPAFAPVEVQLETVRVPALTGEVMLEHKRGACQHLEVRGRCPSGPDETLLSGTDAAYLHVDLGDTLQLGSGLPALRIVGTYRPKPGSTDYWFDLSRLASQPRLEHPRKKPNPYRPAPLFVAAAAFDRLPVDLWRVRADTRLDLGAGQSVADLAAAADRIAAVRTTFTGGGGTFTPSDSTALNSLDDIVTEVRAQQSDARGSITPATVSLILVVLVLLLRLLTAAAELRVPELAIASLRGTTRRRLWVLGMAEPVTLIMLAVPPGLLFGYGLTAALVRAWLVPGLQVPVPAGALLAALVVAVASVGVAALAVQRVVRAPLAEQLSGVRRPAAVGRVVLVAFLAAAAACVAMVVGAFVGATSRKPDLGDFLLPILLAVVAGLAASWLVARLARWYTDRGSDRQRAGRSIAGFVASRAVSRRQEGTLVVLPLTAALAIGTFALGVDHAAASWRESTAATRAPAGQVWASPLGLDETVALTHRLDPDGRWLMAAGASTYPQGLVAIVDAERLARVAAWPDAWLDGHGAQDAQRLLAPPGTVPRFAAHQLSVTADNDLASESDVYLHLELEDSDGPLSADIGPFAHGSSTRSTALPTCEQGCRLRTVTIGKGAALPQRMSGRFAITAVQSQAPARLGLRAGADPDGVIERVSTSNGSVDVTVDTHAATSTAVLNTGGIGSLAPVLVGANAQWDSVPLRGPGRRLTLPDGPLDVRPVATAQSLPFFGPSGVLVDYAAFATTHLRQFDQLSDVTVLARADTPAAVADRLRGADLTLRTTMARERAALDGSAYALALRLYGVTAAMVLLMALAGLVFSTLVQLPARRRDAAALRVVGVRRGQVLGAVARELLVVLGAAATAGVAAGLLAQVVVLRTVTLGYATAINTPEPSGAVDPLRLVVLVALTSVVLGVVALASASATVRGARGATLRESAG
jgi:hypothetical protein